MRRNKRQPGLTLVEALIASIILTVVVAAVSHAVLAGQIQSYDALERLHAVQLAEGLLEEILRLPYHDPNGASSPGPEAGETSRGLYDNLDDFHGYAETAGTLADATGTIYSSTFQGFSRSVTVATGSETVTGFGAAITGVDITVTVQNTAGATWVVHQFYPEPPA